MGQKSRYLFAGVLLSLSASIAAPAVSAQEATIGEVKDFAFNFCPRGWLPAEGQLLPINSNQALYSLLGTTYGGDGRKDFQLPDLRAGTAPAPNKVSGEVKVYQHCGFNGWDQSVGLGEYKAGEFGARSSFVDNDASSVRVSPGWEVQLFDGPNLTGSSVTLTGDESCLVGRSFNDKASSMIVRRSQVQTTPAANSAREKLKTCIAVVGIYPSRN